MSAAEQLDDYLAEPGYETVRDHWAVDSPDAAEWALRKLAKLRRLMAENQAVADEENRRIALWLEETNGTLSRSADFFAAVLMDYHQRILDADPDRKTVSLPSGALKARKHPDRWVFDDDFTAWAKAHRPDLVRTKVEVDKQAAKARLSPVGDAVVDVDSGEKLPGVTVAAGEVKFTVTTGGEA